MRPRLSRTSMNPYEFIIFSTVPNMRWPGRNSGTSFRGFLASCSCSGWRAARNSCHFEGVPLWPPFERRCEFLFWTFRFMIVVSEIEDAFCLLFSFKILWVSINVLFSCLQMVLSSEHVWASAFKIPVENFNRKMKNLSISPSFIDRLPKPVLYCSEGWPRQPVK